MHNQTLLLVDDEVSILRSFAREFRANNYLVTTAANGDEAIQAIGKNNFQAVITDLVMPGCDGLLVVQAAKRRNPASCAIVLTGHGDLTSAVAALRLGADDYLLKPVDSDELLFRLAELLAGRRQLNMNPGKILTVCSYCQTLKEPSGETGEPAWVTWQDYLTRSTGVMLSHGCCPDCVKKVMAGWRQEEDRLPDL